MKITHDMSEVERCVTWSCNWASLIYSLGSRFALVVSQGGSCMVRVHPDQVLACLAKISGTQFEKFFSEFWVGVMGVEFHPLGGMHDGGADGFQDQGLFQGGKPSTFFQASTEADHRRKIRSTIRRLRKFGRDPKIVFYVTNRIVQHVDDEEYNLSEELDLTIRIRDGNWIANNINRNEITKASFVNHLLPVYADEFGAHSIRGPIDVGLNVEACVFLSYEVDNRRARSTLLESVTDTLILWALEDTDPDKGKFLSRDEILQRILGEFPFAGKFIRSNFDPRLEILAAKQNPSGREIRWYQRQDVFCLPFETRKAIVAEHTEFESLIYKVREQFRSAAVDQSEEGKDPADIDSIVEIAIASLESTFKREGLKVGILATGADSVQELSSIGDLVDEEIMKRQLVGEPAYVTKATVMNMLRKAFYESTDEQRSYLQLLSRTYALLFTLQYEPKVVEYFQNMRREFRLYIGSDILIRTLSEFFVPAEDRMTTNMLAILRQANSELFLTEFALEEIWTHIRAADSEFRNYYLEMEPYIDLEVASQIDRILIRAYFYTRLAPLPGIKPPAGWRSYIENFCSYSELHRPAGKDQLRTFLCQKFGLNFVDKNTIENLLDKDEVAAVAKKLLPLKSKEELAINDAQMMLLVYARRAENQERYKGNPYGFSTWWLTHESRIQEKIADYVLKNGAKCIIRPEFLMYFVSMSPSMADVDEMYRRVFPTIHGIRLGSRVRESVVHDLMEKAKKYVGLDPARIVAELETFSNKLKGDQLKRYLPQ